MIETIQRNVLPLIDLVFQKLSPFDELFVDKQLLVGANGQRNFVNSLEEIKDGIVSDPIKYENSIRIDYELNGYKRDGLNTFSTSIQLQWEFDHFKYYLFLDHSGRTNAQAKLYSQHFTEEEMNQLANECGKKMLNKIEDNLTKSK